MIDEHRTEFYSQQQQVKDILHVVDKNQRFKAFKQVYGEVPFMEYQFAGQIGPDITFIKACRKYDTIKYRGDISNAQDSDVTNVNFAYKGEDLGEITVRHKINRKNLKTVHDLMEVSVKSPHWQEGRVVHEFATENISRTNANRRIISLGFYPAANETVAEMLDRISHAITKSQDKAVIAKKLSKLNLPSKVAIKNQDTLVENIVNQIHTADREM